MFFSLHRIGYNGRKVSNRAVYVLRIHELGEFGLIDRLTANLAPVDPSVVVGIGDDAAVLQYEKGWQIVTTTDMLVEGVHFRSDTIDDRSLGWKSVAVSISDIAAMGGRPRHVLLSLAIPPATPVERLDELYAGIDEVCRAFHCHVVGGDVVKTDGPLAISVTLLGEVESGRALLRSGARPGDLVFVTGTIGGSAAGFHCIEKGRGLLPAQEEEALLRFHQRPQPQVRAGRWLLRSGSCTSANDVSDGLSSECNEIAKNSGVRLVLEAERIPLHPAVVRYAKRCGQDPLDWALFGGEDFQLVGTIRAEQAEELLALSAKEEVPLTIIGRVEAGAGVGLRRSGHVQELTPKGFNHFR
jgi:thiamine-monophosphate kinase